MDGLFIALHYITFYAIILWQPCQYHRRQHPTHEPVLFFHCRAADRGGTRKRHAWHPAEFVDVPSRLALCQAIRDGLKSALPEAALTVMLQLTPPGRAKWHGFFGGFEHIPFLIAILNRGCNYTDSTYIHM